MPADGMSAALKIGTSARSAGRSWRNLHRFTMRTEEADILTRCDRARAPACDRGSSGVFHGVRLPQLQAHALRHRHRTPSRVTMRPHMRPLSRVRGADVLFWYQGVPIFG